MSWINIIWRNTATDARAWAVEADCKMPAYVSLALGGNSHSTTFCMTPASAKDLARIIYEAAIELDTDPELIPFQLETRAP